MLEKTTKKKKGSMSVNKKKSNDRNEKNDHNKMKLWKKVYDIFDQNKDQKPYGHRDFKLHLAAYFALRLSSGLGGKYNPTTAMCTQLCFYDEAEKSEIHSFFQHTLEMTKKDITLCMAKGNAVNFKRVILQPQVRQGEKVPVWKSYRELFEKLDIIGFKSNY